MSRAAIRLSLYLAVGCVALSLTACGGAGGGSGGSGGEGTNPMTSPYSAKSVLLLTGSAIYTYPLSGDGTPGAINVTPSATLTAPSGTVFTALAQDSAKNLYVGAYEPTMNPFALEILVYPAGATTPSRTIAGVNTLLSTQGLIDLPQDQQNGILAIVVDNTGQIYTTFGTSIFVFSATADGNVAPTRTISGAATGLYYPTRLAVNSADDLYVTNLGSNLLTGNVYEFDPAANGNVAPIHTWGNTNLEFPWGLDVDSNNDVFVSDTAGGGYIYEFSADGTSPSRSFTTDSPGVGQGSYESFWGVREDKSGYTFVAVESGNTPDTINIRAFSPTATGVSNAVVTFETSAPFARSAQILLQ